MYKLKRDTNEEIQQIKARIPAKGCNQTYGIEELENFSPVVNFVVIILFSTVLEVCRSLVN